MMNITTKTIPHIFRNKYLRETSTTNVVSGGGSGGASLSGDYLPAVKLDDEEGYKVDEPKVEYTGNVIAYGEVIAYAKGTEGGSSSSGDVTIYDGLDSEDPEIALSARQGKILKDLIDTKSGESEISKLLDVEIGELKDGDTLVYDTDSEKWINGTSATLTEEDKTRWNNKLDKEIWDSAFYFDDSGNIRAKVNVIGDKEISAYGAGSSSGNAATATKLATSRTIWGQSFNGTANVSGALTGVTSITASGAVSCASLTATGEVTAYSDQRLKTDIKPLQIRGELNPVTYTKDGKECIGFIAQEVQKLYPELVLADESPEHLLSLNYSQLTAVLCAEIKELRNEINQLKHEIYGIRNNGNNNV